MSKGEISQTKRESLKGDPWRPCVTPLEKRTCGKEKVGGDFPLESSWNDLVERRKKGGKKKREK